MGSGELIFCVAVRAFGLYRTRLGIDALQTLAFVVVAFGNQATTYTNCDRQHMWSSCPSIRLLLSSVVDLLIASTFPISGIAMTALPVFAVAVTLTVAIVFAFLRDLVKVPVFHRLRIT